MKEENHVSQKRKEALEFINKYAYGRPTKQFWYYLNKMETKSLKFPNAHIGRMDDDDVVAYFEMSDEDKFLYSHSAERHQSQAAWLNGIFIGLILAWALVGLYSIII